MLHKINIKEPEREKKECLIIYRCQRWLQKHLCGSRCPERCSTSEVSSKCWYGENRLFHSAGQIKSLMNQTHIKHCVCVLFK